MPNDVQAGHALAATRSAADHIHFSAPQPAGQIPIQVGPRCRNDVIRVLHVGAPLIDQLAHEEPALGRLLHIAKEPLSLNQALVCVHALGVGNREQLATYVG